MDRRTHADQAGSLQPHAGHRARTPPLLKEQEVRVVNSHRAALRLQLWLGWLEACRVQLAQRGAIARSHRSAQPLLVAFSAVFLAAPQLDALAERAPAGLVAGAAFIVLARCLCDITQLVCCCSIVAARRGAKYS